MSTTVPAPTAPVLRDRQRQVYEAAVSPSPTPLLTIVISVMHRRAGPDIQWKWGAGWGASVLVFVGAMVYAHSLDPRTFNPDRPKDGDAYFHPSLSRTADGNFVSADTFMMDEYC